MDNQNRSAHQVDVINNGEIIGESHRALRCDNRSELAKGATIEIVFEPYHCRSFLAKAKLALIKLENPIEKGNRANERSLMSDQFTKTFSA